MGYIFKRPREFHYITKLIYEIIFMYIVQTKAKYYGFFKIKTKSFMYEILIPAPYAPKAK